MAGAAVLGGGLVATVGMAAVAGLVALSGVVGLAGLGLGGAASTSIDPAGTGAAGSPSTGALPGVPSVMLGLYQQAAGACGGLPWTLLAAIGTVESANGTSTDPGVHSGANGAGAEGPMQFEPATFTAYDHPVPAGGADPPSPYDPVDAVWAAARMLCADGAACPSGIAGAVFAYNHSAAYVATVVGLAQRYTSDVSTPPVTPPVASPNPGAGPGPTGATAVAWALSQVGTPYLWGGEAPGRGFDCSGLTQAAWAAAGVSLPRIAQQQYDASPAVTGGTAMEPGDLVFFGTTPASVAHVGIYIGSTGGQTFMVDAPHPGAAVRVEPYPDRVGEAFGTGEVYLGATQPGVL